MSFAPLGAVALAAIPFAGVGGSSGSDSIVANMVASGGIVFGGNVGARAAVRAYMETQDTLVFGGFSKLGEAEFYRVTARPQSFTVRANRAEYTATARFQSFTVRGRR